MLAKRENKRGGGSVQQPLAYLDPTVSVPNASAGSDLLKQQGLIVRPAIEQTGGASVQQPLAYLDPTESVPSAPAGSNLLVQDGLIVRPRIGGSRGGKKSGGEKSGGEKSGGFLPSVMKGVVNSAIVVGPLATYAAHRMLNSTRKKGGSVGPSHPTSGGGKKEDWARNREAAKEELSKYGKPSGLNVNKYAALKRKSEEGAEDWLTEYIVKKRKTAKKGDKKAKNKTEKKPKTKKVKKAKAVKVETAEMWGELLARAKRNLEPFGKPSGANVTRFASIKKQRLNTAAFLANYKTRKQYKEAVFTPRNQYQANLQKARKYLSQFGKPTVANVSKFVSMKRKGESTAAVENAVKGRVKTAVKPVTGKLATAVKSTAHSPPAAGPSHPGVGPSHPTTAKPNWATAYSKAKANLTSIREKPKAYQIATLAGLRRKGENNAKFLQSYRGDK
jgi:hypothetical protein